MRCSPSRPRSNVRICRFISGDVPLHCIPDGTGIDLEVVVPGCGACRRSWITGSFRDKRLAEVQTRNNLLVESSTHRPANQRLLEISTSIQDPDDSHTFSVDAEEHSVRRDDQLSILHHSHGSQFGDNPTPLGMRGKGLGSFPRLVIDSECRRHPVLRSDVVHDVVEILRGDGRPQDAVPSSHAADL